MYSCHTIRMAKRAPRKVRIHNTLTPPHMSRLKSLLFRLIVYPADWNSVVASFICLVAFLYACCFENKLCTPHAIMWTIDWTIDSSIWSVALISHSCLQQKRTASYRLLHPLLHILVVIHLKVQPRLSTQAFTFQRQVSSEYDPLLNVHDKLHCSSPLHRIGRC